MKSLFWLLIFISAAEANSYSNEQIIDSNKVYGVTLDGIGHLNDEITSLSNLHYKPTTRIVFDEWQPASGYLTAVTQIHNVSFVMGEILDSYYMNQYSYEQFASRVTEYMNILGDNVDIWEIGNEVNGEWCGTTESVIKKINMAFKIAKYQNKKTALTLYYNKNCWSNPENEMFRWVNNFNSAKQRLRPDYVLVSYYEDDCNNFQPNWQQVFDSLHVLFPKSKLGIGECGTTNASKKETYINRYYSMNINTPDYIGGYFWWYYRQDCVPYSKPLWTVINNAMTGNTDIAEQKTEPIKLGNYPNPFNPATVISYQIKASPNPSQGGAHEVKLIVYDIQGREVTVLVNQEQTAGSYKVNFDGTNLSSGVYFYKLEIRQGGSSTEYFSDIKKMVLMK